MKVNSTGSQAVAETKAKEAPRKSGPVPPAKSHSVSESGSAKTEISSRAREFSKAKAVAHAAPEVREERVAELRKRLAEGSYDVSPEAIADKLVDEHMRTVLD